MISSNCTLSTCPVSSSPLGYQPDLAANAVGVAVFILCLILQLIFGIKWRTWSYMIAMGCGCAAEALGYIGRLILYRNPWSSDAFAIQIVTLTFAPAFLAAGIYLNLKHVVLVFGPQYSRLNPKQYTWIFVCCDIVSIVVQALGSGYSATTNANETTASDVVLFGLATQVVTLSIFGILAVEYFYRERRGLAFPVKSGSWRETYANQKTKPREKTRSFKLFTVAIVVAFVTILTRCIYRVVEGADGWHSSIMRNQGLFIGLDEAMCIIAAVSLSVLHPGYCLTKIDTQSVQYDLTRDTEQGLRSSVLPSPAPDYTTVRPQFYSRT